MAYDYDKMKSLQEIAQTLREIAAELKKANEEKEQQTGFGAK